MALQLRLLFIFLMAASTAQAFLISVKHSGMAIAGAAYAQDAESGGINPALAVEAGTRIDTGLSYIHSRGSATVTGNVAPPLAGGLPTNGTFNPYDKKNFYNPHFGVVKHFHSPYGAWAMSLVSYNKSHAYAQYNNTFPLLGTSNLRTEILHEIICPMVAYKPNRYFSVGVGVNIVIQKFKAFGLEKLTLTAPVTFSTDPAAVTNRGNNFSKGAGVVLGAKVNPFSWLSFGVSWQPKIKMERFHKYQGLLAERGRMDHPETWNCGVMVQPLHCVHILFDIQYIKYGDIPSLANPLSPNFTLGILGNPNYRLGGPLGAGFGWNNATIYRLGADYLVNDQLTVRAGWRHGGTPFPKSENAFNLATDEVTEDYLTCGATWNWNCELEISFYAAVGLHNRRRGQGSIPPALGGGEVELNQSKNAFGLSIGKLF